MAATAVVVAAAARLAPLCRAHPPHRPPLRLLVAVEPGELHAVPVALHAVLVAPQVVLVVLQVVLVVLQVVPRVAEGFSLVAPLPVVPSWLLLLRQR